MRDAPGGTNISHLDINYAKDFRRLDRVPSGLGLVMLRLVKVAWFRASTEFPGRAFVPKQLNFLFKSCGGTCRIRGLESNVILST